MNCRRCGGLVPSYTTRRADMHADELECWQYQRAAICSLEDRVDILQGLMDSLKAHEHGAEYAPPIVTEYHADPVTPRRAVLCGDYADAIVPDSDGGALAECDGAYDAALGKPRSQRRVKLVPGADGDGGEYHQRADVVDGVVLHDPEYHGR